MSVNTLTPAELRARLDTGDIVLLDVRTEAERRTAAIEPCTHIPLDALDARVGELDPDAAIVVMCHHGMRSELAARLLLRSGFVDVAHLGGGIDAWSREVDPSVPRY